MPFAPVADTAMYYERRGNGQPLLLVQGLGASGEQWSDEFLTPLARTASLIIVDNRGTGRTRRGTAPYSLRLLADDALAVLDHCGISEAAVFGVSMGGMVAQELALAPPRRVSRLVLGCTTAGGAAMLRPSFPGVSSPSTSGGNILDPAAAVAMLVTPEFARAQPGFLARMALRGMRHPTSPAVIGEQVRAIAAFDASVRLSALTMPVLVLTGDRDRLMPPENSYRLARLLPTAQGVTVRNTGHCFFWEAPERTARVIGEFLSS